MRLLFCFCDDDDNDDGGGMPYVLLLLLSPPVSTKAIEELFGNADFHSHVILFYKFTG